MSETGKKKYLDKAGAKRLTENLLADIAAVKNEALPIASKTQHGIVKIGDNLEISEDGVLSAAAGAGTVVTPPSPPSPEVTFPVYDDATGRYDNASIENWMNSYADGLVYGVQIPVYAASTVTTATKTDANAGLVLEPSTNEVAGRNDYTGKKLFFCPRVNGGVDVDGLPYVTAIEGLDDRFDCVNENTFALTPVYYVKYTETSEYIWQQYCDTAIEGFKACPGAYTSNNVLRPYILRACYMDSDGDCSSRSGERPASEMYEGAPSNFKHCLQNDFEASKGRDDGLTMLTYGDITYLTEFMQLMLGVKAPNTAAKGCANYYLRCSCAAAESNSKRIVLTSSNAELCPVGAYVCVGTSYTITNAAAHSIVYAAKVLSKEELGSENVALTLDVPDNISTTTSSRVMSMPYANGSCDKVMGSFGCFYEDGLTSGYAPFRFQNCEWVFGMREIVANMYRVGTKLYVAPDMDACSAVDASDGWVELNTTLPASTTAGNIGDYRTDHGVRVPTTFKATSTTGYCASYTRASTAESGAGWATNGATVASADNGNGVGRVETNYTSSSSGNATGSRASAIGHSALSE